MTTDILIVGGGLAGLALAERLEGAGRDYRLVEARPRPGGRILTEHVGAASFDLGPAWFWPGQPRIAALMDRFGLPAFAQYYEGAPMYEDEQGRALRGRGFASMQGSLRVHGGLGALTAALADALPANRLLCGAAVTGLARTPAGVTATLEEGSTIAARRVVLALPPSVAVERIGFTPALPAATTRAMASIPTWMAGQAKAVAVYDTPFWREDGLSGDAMSRFGPMVEVHDASPARGGPFALFGFIGVPPAARADEDRLRAAIVQQLVRLFGPAAGAPVRVLLKDWAADPLTTTAPDLTPLQAHPRYGLPPAMAGLWDGALHFGGTEVATDFGGYLEGALEAAETVLDKVIA